MCVLNVCDNNMSLFWLEKLTSINTVLSMQLEGALWRVSFVSNTNNKGTYTHTSSEFCSARDTGHVCQQNNVLRVIFSTTKTSSKVWSHPGGKKTQNLSNYIPSLIVQFRVGDELAEALLVHKQKSTTGTAFHQKKNNIVLKMSHSDSDDELALSAATLAALQEFRQEETQRQE